MTYEILGLVLYGGTYNFLFFMVVDLLRFHVSFEVSLGKLYFSRKIIHFISFSNLYAVEQCVLSFFNYLYVTDISLFFLVLVISICIPLSPLIQLTLCPPKEGTAGFIYGRIWSVFRVQSSTRSSRICNSGLCILSAFRPLFLS